jgi:mannose-6-phosphate isomerase-like protein (cupin superfamily)
LQQRLRLIAMKTFDAAALAGPRDWSGPTIGTIGGATAKLRWINAPFEWHRNTGAELFLVLDGEVDMHVRCSPDSPVAIVRLASGQMLLIEEGEEHVAHPRGEARILVVEED